MYGMRVVDARFASADAQLPATAEAPLDAEVWTRMPRFDRGEPDGLEITDFGNGPVVLTRPDHAAPQRLLIDLAARDGKLARVVFPHACFKTDPERRLFVVMQGWSDVSARGEPAFLCPVCLAYSHHPRDVASGYCGRCHKFTGAGRG